MKKKRKIYFEKVVSLKDLLLEDFLPDALFERNYYLENGKCISRVWVELTNVSMNRKSDWQTILLFL